MKDNGGSGGGVVMAFVLGAIAGAAVALLMAPAAGDDVRRALGEKAREGRERANEAARQGREFLDRQRENIATAVERGRDAYQQARTSATPSSGGDRL